MSENLIKYSFEDLIHQTKIRIPKIQRDYAQGRTCPNVNEIRKDFIHTLLPIVKGIRPDTELDFVYGSNKDNAFEPLDGQQRLTTLFLLHWMMGVKLNTAERGQSIFTYETRNTSREFCDELVLHSARQYVDEAIEKTKNTDKEIKPSDIIRGRDWFKFEWKYDPTILSMLVMIDAIYDEMGNEWSMNLETCRRNLSNITFHLLNLGDFGLSNELFIKMNARGKQLSDFDKLKSTLEEELQLQQKEKNEDDRALSSAEDEDNWRTFMDGIWIDFFWHKYARETIISTEQAEDADRQHTRLSAAKNTERQFRKLIIRLVALQLFANNHTGEKVRQAAYKIDEADLDGLMSAYHDSLLKLRSDAKHCIVPKTQVMIDFKQLMTDINSLICRNQNGIYSEISGILPEYSHIEKNKTTLFESFLAEKVPNDVELIFYAMLLFLRHFPVKKSEIIAGSDDISNHEKWCINLQNWVLSMRNILLNDNNNQRIDKIFSSFEAAQSLNLIMGDMVTFIENGKLDIYEDESIVLQFLKSGDKTYKRLDNQSLDEERKKARLKLLDPDWNPLMKYAETHRYLWGQIRCLLNWAQDDKKLFEDYGKRLISILDMISSAGNKFYAALLAFAPDCWHKTNRLFQYNKDRDNSFKRCLREPEGQVLFRSLIDNWRDNHSEKSIEEYLDSLIIEKREAADTVPWLRCILKCPEIIDYASYKRVYFSNGHVVLAERKTPDSHCVDPVFKYFAEVCRKKGLKNKLHDSKGEYTHAFEFSDNGEKKYLIQWEGSAGEYSIKTDDENTVVYQPDKMFSIVEGIIGNS
ncbi:MAG: DUF262 domain-containing protein [Lentisphaeria bacterium]|nr:DUF262 domain-containing protein [Lentisphaeria bacterium]